MQKAAKFLKYKTIYFNHIKVGAALVQAQNVDFYRLLVERVKRN